MQANEVRSLKNQIRLLNTITIVFIDLVWSLCLFCIGKHIILLSISLFESFFFPLYMFNLVFNLGLQLFFEEGKNDGGGDGGSDVDCE